MDSLIHCIYASAAKSAFSDPELMALLKQARATNAGQSITGMLIYAEGSFFQVIEGKTEDVDRLYAKISADPRHEKITQIIREFIPARAFGDWTMGYSVMSREEIEAIEGLNDFFGTGFCLTQVDMGRARKLLSSFAAGRWRSRRSGTAERRTASSPLL